MKHRIYIELPADRDAVVMALAHNGYTTRFGRERTKPGTKYRHFVEFWRDEV